MNITLYPKVLYRVPIFSIDANLLESWEELKAAIALSSPDFHVLIKDVSQNELETLSESIQFTIWKYFNRAKYRATPYANFAGVGLCNLKKGKNGSELRIEESQLLHQKVDWPHKDQITIKASQVAAQNLKLFANSSYYLVKDAIRYISFIDGEFQLSDIDYYETVIALLECCTKPINYIHLLTTLEAKGHYLEEPIELLDQLLELQLIMTSSHPNIIGEDYFQRIGLSINQYNDSYILSERKLLSGMLNENDFRNLIKVVPLLRQLTSIVENPSLKQFSSKLYRRFGSDEVPIMQALDPETGIGYDDLAQAAQTDELVDLFVDNSGKKAEINTLKQLLITNISKKSTGNILSLNDIHLNQTEKNIPLPNTLSALLSVADGLINIDAIGGSTATALLGRFSLTNDEIAETCRKLAQLECEANPEVLFFDIAYIAEKKIDNVSRRKQIYPFQLSILNYDTSDSPLTIDDITISTNNSELLLWSKRHNKRLIPRLSSAYNYGRSDLSLFRLLCDLQSQGLQTNISLNLQALLPNANCYPRLQYGNIILSPAKWKIEQKDIQENPEAHLNQLGVGRYFKAGSGDQTLCFDRLEPKDMHAFSNYMKKQKNTYIEEAFVPQNSFTKDSEGRSYQSQFLISLTHKQEIYRTGFRRPINNCKNQVVRQIIPPGNEWLYFEIYCHSTRTDELLAGPIKQFLKLHKAKIETWFFIRYFENGSHIRLRIQLKDSSVGYLLMASLSKFLTNYIETGIVSELLLKTYKRETARYGWTNFKAIERHFSCDSNYVVTLLKVKLSADEKYGLVIELATSLKNAGVFNHAEFKLLTHKCSEMFNQEHQLQPVDFKKLNVAYKKFRMQNISILTAQQKKAFVQFEKSFVMKIINCASLQKQQLFSDLIHMHVNRLFDSNQRTHEMIIYYFLTRELLREEATHIHNINTDTI